MTPLREGGEEEEMSITNGDASTSSSTEVEMEVDQVTVRGESFLHSTTISTFILNYQLSLGQLHSVDVTDHSEWPFEPVWLMCTTRGCWERLKDEEALVRHLFLEHSVWPNMCALSDCPKSFATIRSLHEHLLTDHAGESEWRCPVSVDCQGIYCGYIALNRHIFQFHKRGCFACISCAYQGFTRADMIQHYRREHTTNTETEVAQVAPTASASAAKLTLPLCTSNGVGSNSALAEFAIEIARTMSPQNALPTVPTSNSESASTSTRLPLKRKREIPVLRPLTSKEQQQMLQSKGRHPRMATTTALNGVQCSTVFISPPQSLPSPPSPLLSTPSSLSLSQETTFQQPPAQALLILRPPPPPTQPFALQSNCKLGLPLPPIALRLPIKELPVDLWPLRFPPVHQGWQPRPSLLPPPPSLLPLPFPPPAPNDPRLQKRRRLD